MQLDPIERAPAPRLIGSAPHPLLWAEAARLVPAKVAAEFIGVPRFIPVGERTLEIATATQLTFVQKGVALTPKVVGGVFVGWRRHVGTIRQHIALCMGAGYRGRLLQAIAAASGGQSLVDPATYWANYWQANLGHSEPDADLMATGWANQGTGGTSGDLSQTTASAQPTYDEVNATFNNQATLLYADDVMQTSNTFWEQAADGEDFSCYSVAQVTDAANTHNYVIGTSAAASNGGLVFGLNAGGVSRFYQYGSGGSPSITNTFSGCTVNAVHVLTGQFTGAVSTATDENRVILDGGTPDTQTGDISGPIASSGSPAFCIGGQATTTGNYVGNIAEVAFEKVILTSGEKGDSENWVNDRYNLSITSMW